MVSFSSPALFWRFFTYAVFNNFDRDSYVAKQWQEAVLATKQTRVLPVGKRAAKEVNQTRLGVVIGWAW
jgi:hypothetical protein